MDLPDGEIQRLYAVDDAEQIRWRDIIFEEQPYLANVYPGDTREIGIMNQSENRRYLIEELLKEQLRYAHMQNPEDAEGQKQLLRSLMNVRMPKKIRPEFLQVQDAYLQEAAKEKGVVTLAELEASKPDLYIWKDD